MKKIIKIEKAGHTSGWASRGTVLVKLACEVQGGVANVAAVGLARASCRAREVTASGAALLRGPSRHRWGRCLEESRGRRQRRASGARRAAVGEGASRRAGGGAR
jgi:hypothetical protein